MTTKSKAILWIFYGGLGALMLLITTGLLGQVLPSSLAQRVAYNSEGYLFALALGTWVQLILPRIAPSWRLPWGLAYGALWGAIGVGLILSDLPSRIRTLNEAALALAMLIPFVALRRRGTQWALLVVPIAVVLTAWAVVAAPESWVIDQAETFGFIVLALLTIEFFDRPLLGRDAVVNKTVCWAWYAFMLAEPIVVSAIGTDARAGGGGGALLLEYLGRIHESFVGVLLLALVLHLVPAYRRDLTRV